MLQPKRRKYRKEFRGRRRGVSIRGSQLEHGEFGIKSLGVAWLSAAQIEAGRRAITNSLKRKGRIWIRVFPDKPVTSRPAGQRMGSGKGEIHRYVSVVTPGRIIFEVTGPNDEVVLSALKKAADKLPFKTKVVRKEEK
jgi:large subunit ribosomal protein L16